MRYSLPKDGRLMSLLSVIGSLSQCSRSIPTSIVTHASTVYPYEVTSVHDRITHKLTVTINHPATNKVCSIVIDTYTYSYDTEYENRDELMRILIQLNDVLSIRRYDKLVQSCKMDTIISNLQATINHLVADDDVLPPSVTASMLEESEGLLDRLVDDSYELRCTLDSPYTGSKDDEY